MIAEKKYYCVYNTIDDLDDIILTSDDKEKPFGSLEKIESGYDKFLKSELPFINFS